MSRALAIGLETRAADDQLVGRGIFLFDPIERLLALDILQPEIGILVVGSGCRHGDEGTAKGKRCKAGADHSIVSPGVWWRCASIMTHCKGSGLYHAAIGR